MGIRERRNQIIREATEHPETRSHLVPLLRKQARLFAKRKLFEWLEQNGGPAFDGVTQKGLNHPRISDETYGSKSMIYINWGSPAERKQMEPKLRDAGFPGNKKYSPGSSTSEVQVAWFKGWHWDE